MRAARFSVLLGGIVVSIFVAELLVRFVAPIPEEKLLPFYYNVDRVRQISKGDTFITYDPDLGWILTPSRTRRADGAVYRLNDKSIRADHEYPLEPRTDKRRITAFGDSFTFCSEVTQDACWTVQLEEALPQIEVLNFGVPGYGPDQAWLRYQRDGRQFGGCAVLIGYYVGDLERTVNRFRPFIHPDDSVVLSKPRFLLDDDGVGLTLMPNPITDLDQLLDPVWVERTLGQHDSWYFPDTFVAGPFDSSWLVRLARTAAYQRHRQTLLRGDRSYDLYQQDHEAFQITRRVLTQFSEEARARGQSPVIVVMPGKDDLAMVSAGVKPYDLLLRQLREAGAPTLDMTPGLLEEMQRRSLDDLFEDQHYSKRGNGVVAQEIARQLPDLVQTTCEPLAQSPAAPRRFPPAATPTAGRDADAG